MRFTKKEIESIEAYSKSLLKYKKNNVKYPGRRNTSDDSRNYAANNKRVQKLFKQVFNLNK